MAFGTVVSGIIISLQFLLFTLPSGSEAIMCYQCNSAVDENCDTLKGNETYSTPYYKPCDEHDGQQIFCRKIVQHVKDIQKTRRVIRRCGWEKNVNNQPCYRFEDDDHKETVCQCFNDGCNGSLSLFSRTPQPLLIILFTLLFIIQ